MPGKIEFEIHGAREMEKLLLELGAKAANQIGRQAVRAGARVIANDAKRRVHRRTGNLGDGIKVIVPRRSPADQVVALIGFSSDPVPDPRRKTGEDIASRRAHFEEFGTSRQAAHPFVRPAMDAKAGEALEAMGKTMARGITREAEKLARK